MKILVKQVVRMEGEWNWLKEVDDILSLYPSVIMTKASPFFSVFPYVLLMYVSPVSIVLGVPGITYAILEDLKVIN